MEARNVKMGYKIFQWSAEYILGAHESHMARVDLPVLVVGPHLFEGSDDSSNESDSERADGDGESSFGAAAAHQTLRTHAAADVIEIRDSPSPDLLGVPGLEPDEGGENESLASFFVDREVSPSIEAVDTDEGTLQTRAAHLIAQILNLRGLDSWPSITGAADLGPVHSASLSPAPMVSTSYTTLQGGQRCLYFVGVQTLSTVRTFCQLRDFADMSPHDGAIFLRLQGAGGLVGRALSSVFDRSAYFVGTSDYPIDMASNYANYQHGFREISSLFELESSYSHDNVFFPVPASPRRSELLAAQHQPENIPVYVLYVYHQDAEPFTAHAPVAQTPPIIAAPAGAAPAAISSLPTSIPNFLLERFASQYADLGVWRARDYGTAYNHCLTERQILSICHALGIGLLGRTHTPAHVGDMTIRLEDVVSAAGINFQTFSTMRTELRMIKEAHLLLRQRDRAGLLMAVYVPLLRFLDTMMAERVLDPVISYVAGTNEVEFSVVRCQITNLMGEVRGVLDSLVRR
ncbi:hypothetical protein B0H15DRAFT_807654 [Mycena belliarum]|uniref:Uncharacterized protein n=1 Tax=Mycena belliarum TaxID=1033014 RepID=A0AAD6TQU3_9AGAR|nr:hypothetical protein B0H15DRAFT_807654 [Mycena belliae]